AALKKSHLDLLSVIDIKIDRGTARVEDLNSRTESVKILGFRGERSSSKCQGQMGLRRR
ncbi:hypothetical protein Tco_0671389, partial [Tanacetum coccineum]